MARLAGKTALITGAASGIGLATARRFLAEGANVIAADVAPAAAEPGPHYPQHLNVTDESSWRNAVETAEARFGALNVLVNNAGVGHPSNLEELSLKDWRRVMSVNLDGVFLGIKQAAPALRRAGGGAIVNVASMLGSIATVNASAYCASKAGVIGLTRAAALELAPAGIRVAAIQPGYVETPLLAGRLSADPERRQRLISQTPAGRLGAPEEIAAAIAFLASDEAAFVTGTGLLIDGGYTAH